ncbi:MAG TPA: sulfite exporter TauE/SafE family protein [Longimicrobiales bacterium]|nr:sulfite exporter TauE/SafE family protein [Longimicrobiales bacterium]
MLPAITAAALAGLLGSPHCVAMCGPFSLACGSRVGHNAAWHAGKTLTYALLGALAGWAGHSVPGPTWVATAVSATLVIWFAAALAGIVPEPAVRIPGLTRLASRAAARGDLASRFVFGMANGLLPCGLVYATLGIAVASGDALTGAAAMAAFGLGTVPALAAFGLGVRRLAADRPWIRRALAVLVLITGLWMVARRQAMPAGMHGGAHVTGEAAPAAPHR